MHIFGGCRFIGESRYAVKRAWRTGEIANKGGIS
jgi:hypothetical protein